MRRGAAVGQMQIKGAAAAGSTWLPDESGWYHWKKWCHDARAEESLSPQRSESQRLLEKGVSEIVVELL